MNDLAEKVKASVERMKAFEPPEGYMLAFSGGKDSVVLKALADMDIWSDWTPPRCPNCGAKMFMGG